MPVATPAVRFTVDRDVVDASGCRLLSWSASAVRRLRLGGKAVPSVGNQSVCPDKETTYYLWFEGQDGRPGDRSVTIRLATPTSMPIAGIAPEEERPARETELPPTLEPTPCDTECVVIMPTETPRPTRTARPTRPADPTEEPRPTEPPATAEPPTAPPDPTDEPAATEVPKPTEEPSPDPPR